MIYLRLPPFNPVSAGARASLAIPRYDMTLGRVVLKFSGNITKATIGEIVVKIGARVVFGPISGAELDKLNKYRGIADKADRLTIDLTERDGLSVVAKEVGGIDIPALFGQDVFVEVVNTAAAGAMSLDALGGFTALQFDPRNPNPDGQLIRKVLGYQIPTSGGTQVTWTPSFKGALIQRIHFHYAGTDWGAAANGNLVNVEVKKNGVAIWDRIECLDNRFIQAEHQKAPQSKVYTLDFVHDNVHSAAMATADARALEFNFQLTAADQIRAIVECLDAPNNL